MKADFKRFLNLHTLQGKMFVIILAVALLVMALSLTLCCYLCVDAVEELTAGYMTNYIRFADETLSEKLDNAVMTSLTVTADQEIVHETIQSSAALASYRWFQQYKPTVSLLNGVISDKPYITTAALVLLDGRIYQSTGGVLRGTALQEDWFLRTVESASMQVDYLNDGVPMVRVACPIIRARRVSAVVMLEMSFQELAEAFRLSPLEGMSLYTYSPEGVLMYQSGDTPAPPVQPGRPGEITQSYQTLGGEQYFLVQYESAASGLTTVGIIDTHTMIFGALRLTDQIAGIAALCLILAILASCVFSAFLCRNLNALIESMQAVRRGNVNVRARIQSKDEIGEVAGAFNTMMERIRSLLDEVRVQEEEKRRAEQEVLAAQIKPHFVYNAISAIQYVASMRGQKDIEAAALSLSSLLRSVLGNRDEFITLWEEREYIEHYIALQRFKFQNSFRLVWEVDEALWAMRLPKLLLQPIVENALIHGIALREDGLITVKGSHQGGETVLKVIDNGRGMDERQIAACVSEGREPSTFRHVGLPNVLLRVRAIYGPEAACQIFSSSNRFTCVELHLPDRKEEWP